MCLCKHFQNIHCTRAFALPNHIILFLIFHFHNDFRSQAGPWQLSPPTFSFRLTAGLQFIHNLFIQQNIITKVTKTTYYLATREESESAKMVAFLFSLKWKQSIVRKTISVKWVQPAQVSELMKPTWPVIGCTNFDRHSIRQSIGIIQM